VVPFFLLPLSSLPSLDEKGLLISCIHAVILSTGVRHFVLVLTPFFFFAPAFPLIYFLSNVHQLFREETLRLDVDQIVDGPTLAPCQSTVSTIFFSPTSWDSRRPLLKFEMLPVSNATVGRVFELSQPPPTSFSPTNSWSPQVVLPLALLTAASPLSFIILFH